jgi:hypothetical protein
VILCNPAFSLICSKFRIIGARESEHFWGSGLSGSEANRDAGGGAEKADQTIKII